MDDTKATTGGEGLVKHDQSVPAPKEKIETEKQSVAGAAKGDIWAQISADSATHNLDWHKPGDKHKDKLPYLEFFQNELSAQSLIDAIAASAAKLHGDDHFRLPGPTVANLFKRMASSLPDMTGNPEKNESEEPGAKKSEARVNQFASIKQVSLTSLEPGAPLAQGQAKAPVAGEIVTKAETVVVRELAVARPADPQSERPNLPVGVSAGVSVGLPANLPVEASAKISGHDTASATAATVKGDGLLVPAVVVAALNTSSGVPVITDSRGPVLVAADKAMARHDNALPVTRLEGDGPVLVTAEKVRNSAFGSFTQVALRDDGVQSTADKSSVEKVIGQPLVIGAGAVRPAATADIVLAPKVTVAEPTNPLAIKVATGDGNLTLSSAPTYTVSHVLVKNPDTESRSADDGKPVRVAHVTSPVNEAALPVLIPAASEPASVSVNSPGFSKTFKGVQQVSVAQDGVETVTGKKVVNEALVVVSTGEQLVRNAALLSAPLTVAQVSSPRSADSEVIERNPAPTLDRRQLSAREAEMTRPEVSSQPQVMSPPRGDNGGGTPYSPSKVEVVSAQPVLVPAARVESNYGLPVLVPAARVDNSPTNRAESGSVVARVENQSPSIRVENPGAPVRVAAEVRNDSSVVQARTVPVSEPLRTAAFQSIAAVSLRSDGVEDNGSKKIVSDNSTRSTPVIAASQLVVREPESAIKQTGNDAPVYAPERPAQVANAFAVPAAIATVPGVTRSIPSDADQSVLARTAVPVPQGLTNSLHSLNPENSLSHQNTPSQFNPANPAALVNPTSLASLPTTANPASIAALKEVSQQKSEQVQSTLTLLGVAAEPASAGQKIAVSESISNATINGTDAQLQVGKAISIESAANGRLAGAINHADADSVLQANYVATLSGAVTVSRGELITPAKSDGLIALGEIKATGKGKGKESETLVISNGLAATAAVRTITGRSGGGGHTTGGASGAGVGGAGGAASAGSGSASNTAVVTAATAVTSTTGTAGAGGGTDPASATHGPAAAGTTGAGTAGAGTVGAAGTTASPGTTIGPNALTGTTSATSTHGTVVDPNAAITTAVGVATTATVTPAAAADSIEGVSSAGGDIEGGVKIAGADQQSVEAEGGENGTTPLDGSVRVDYESIVLVTSTLGEDGDNAPAKDEKEIERGIKPSDKNVDEAGKKGRTLRPDEVAYLEEIERKKRAERARKQKAGGKKPDPKSGAGKANAAAKLRRCIILKGDTFEILAAQYLGDSILGTLIYQVNPGFWWEKREGGKIYLELLPGTVIFLPTAEEITQFRYKLLSNKVTLLEFVYLQNTQLRSLRQAVRQSSSVADSDTANLPDGEQTIALQDPAENTTEIFTEDYAERLDATVIVVEDESENDVTAEIDSQIFIAQTAAKNPTRRHAGVITPGQAGRFLVSEQDSLLRDIDQHSRVVIAPLAQTEPDGKCLVRVEVYTAGKWQIVLQYVVDEDPTLHVYSLNGSKREIKIQLPAPVVKDMAINDLTSNRIEYARRFLTGRKVIV